MSRAASFSDRTAPESNKDKRTDRCGRRIPLDRRMFFFGDDDLEGEASLLDISTNGCRATSLTEVKVDSVLKVSIFLSDQPWPLRVEEAVVRWVDGEVFGLEFVGIRPAQRERLRGIVMKSGG